MMQRVEEIYWLRCYGCLAVFAFHFLDRIDRHYDHLLLDLARIPTVLGTPIFLFISIFLFAARYGRHIPDGFLSKRVQYVMVPYLVYGLIYSSAEYVRVNAGGGEVGLVENAVAYLIHAGWHGYFLIIAMQFYVYYWLYVRYGLERWLVPGPCLVITGLIGMAFWGLTRFLGIDPPGYLLWIVPFGWLYLFFLALLLVRHFPPPYRARLLSELARPRWLAAMVGVVVLLSLPGWLEYSSKEVWVVPLFVLFALWAMQWLHGRPAPPLVRRINEASFGIYLAHPMFFSIVDVAGLYLHFPLPLYAVLLVVVGLAGSIGLNLLANRLSWGGLLFGKRLRVA